MQFHRSTFENDTVELDGNAYDHCDFKHCILVYRGGSPPRFAQCSFLQYSFQFEDAAGNTLSFMASLYRYCQVDEGCGKVKHYEHAKP